jgi:hypothetical protein
MRPRVLLSVLMLCVNGALNSVRCWAQSPHEAELKSLNERVAALCEARKYIEALPLAERFEAGDKAHYGEEDPIYAGALSLLAVVLENTPGKVAQAEPLLRRALAIDEKALGQDHNAVIRDLNNLASSSPYPFPAIRVRELLFSTFPYPQADMGGEGCQSVPSPLGEKDRMRGD